MGSGRVLCLLLDELLGLSSNYVLLVCSGFLPWVVRSLLGLSERFGVSREWRLEGKFRSLLVSPALVIKFWRVLTLESSAFILTSVQGMLLVLTIVTRLERSLLSWFIWLLQDSLLSNPLVISWVFMVGWFLCCVTSCLK